ncbi:MAG: porin family protein [bacterium]|nr:porin family protein [bacterium]MCP5041290.1 porin family protein [bacterium]
MRGIQRTAALVSVLALIAVPIASASAQSSSGFTISEGDPATNDWRGLYAKLGLAIGFPDEDYPGSVDIDPGAAVAFGGGYRWNRWVATEIDFNVIAGADVEGVSDDLTIFAFTVNVKGYPLAGLDKDAFPQWIQPYGLFGMGGGEADLGDFGDESSFMVRFNVGADFMIWDHFGLFVDTGYLIITENDTALNGEGQLIMGGTYRF